MSRSSRPSYRPEIDGLRAIAVLPVVLYHFGVPGLGGGYVGVDIFFVISGYLIGGILWAELEETGRIRLGRFFLRRVRRLAPAYLAMALATFVGAWFVLLPFDFREFGQELVAATVYLANVHFWNEAGYFDSAADRKLLLHTWSLAVEEQFYLVLPTLMLALAGVRRRLPGLLVGLGVLSLAACLWMMTVSQPAAFYLFPFRAWELLAGVYLAIAGQRAGFGWEVHGGLSWAGLALIAVAVTGFTAGEHFPGLYALVPVLGAVLIIANGRHENPVNAMLKSPPFLFFGLISYSLYLWHWPMVTLLTYWRGEAGIGPGLILVLLVATVAVSWLSWKLVETPVRRGTLSAPRLLGGYAAGAAALLAVALSFAFSDGWPGRFSPETAPYIAATQDFNQDWSRCHTPRDGAWAGLRICPIGPEGAPRVLVWGDSHGRAFKEGIDLLARETGTPGLLIWRGGCPPLLGVRKEESVSTPAEEAACAADAGRVQRALAETPSVESVLLIGRWAYYATGRGFGRDAQNRIALSPAPESGLSAGPGLFAAAVDHTLDVLSGSALSEKGRRVFVLRQVPEMAAFSAGTAARSLAYGQMSAEEVRSELGRTPRAALEARFAEADAALREAAGQAGRARVIDLWPAFCTPEACEAYLEGRPVYFDNNHVTNTGARALRTRFADVFAEG